ncbi:MAG: oxidoreductase [Proteobacteria bacterium]|nr:oxidoreductase [Pseudomonadota bacterium]
MSAYAESSVPDQAGKTVLVTGANTGIGYEAARVLAGRGARVLLGCRSEAKAADAGDRIRAQHPDAEVVWVPLDLTSLKSVAEAAEIAKREPRLDVLVNNAGVMIPPLTRTEDGFELQFGVNHLGHFALTGQLLERLASTPGARIVNVSSKAHVPGRIDFDDPHAERSYSPIRRYQMSKAANLYFTFELSRRLAAAGIDVTAVACHPGVADTELSRTFPAWFGLIAPILRPLFNTPAEGALPTLLAATAPDAEPNAYYGPQKRGETARSAGPAKIARHVRDEQVAKKLWELSAELTGVSYLEG